MQLSQLLVIRGKSLVVPLSCCKTTASLRHSRQYIQIAGNSYNKDRQLPSYQRNLLVALVNRQRYGNKTSGYRTIRIQAPKFQLSRNMEKVQRLNVCRLEELINSNDSLSYSLFLLERVSGWSFVSPVVLGLHCEFQRTMTQLGNELKSSV